MTAAILALLAALIPFAIWLWKRRAAKADDPVEQHREKYEQIETPVARGGDAALSADLDELERLQNAGRQRGPDRDAH